MDRANITRAITLGVTLFGVFWVVFEFSYNQGSLKSSKIDDRQDKEIHDIKESMTSITKAIENQSKSIEILSINQENIVKTLDDFSYKLGDAVRNIDENQEQILRHHVIQTTIMRNQENNYEQILVLFKELLKHERHN